MNTQNKLEKFRMTVRGVLKAGEQSNIPKTQQNAKLLGKIFGITLAELKKEWNLDISECMRIMKEEFQIEELEDRHFFELMDDDRFIDFNFTIVRNFDKFKKQGLLFRHYPLICQDLMNHAKALKLPPDVANECLNIYLQIFLVEF